MPIQIIDHGVGDFNVTIGSHERNTGGRVNSCMESFNDFLPRGGLIDLPLMGIGILGIIGKIRLSCLGWIDS